MDIASEMRLVCTANEMSKGAHFYHAKVAKGHQRHLSKLIDPERAP